MMLKSATFACNTLKKTHGFFVVLSSVNEKSDHPIVSYHLNNLLIEEIKKKNKKNYFSLFIKRVYRFITGINL